MKISAIKKHGNDLQPKYSNSTINSCLGLLNLTFNKAVEWEIINFNPGLNVKRFKEDNTDMKIVNNLEKYLSV